MSKYKLVYIDSAKKESEFFNQGIFCLNLNSLIKRKFNEKTSTLLFPDIQLPRVINLCNLSSLCFKLQINYNSIECLQLLDTIISIIKNKRDDVIFVQSNIENYFEIDLKPISFSSKVDKNNGIIYISKILKDILNDLGYTDCQLLELISSVQDISKVIPKDKLAQTIYDSKNKRVYKMIKEILNC